MTEKILNIVQLYPREMNIYGDNGNVLVLKKRAELYGFATNFREFEIGDSRNILDAADIILSGGGQDSGQNLIIDDLQKNGEILRGLAQNGVAMLVICGLYQLFGNFYQVNEREKMDGIGIFDMETVASSRRLIGNIVTKTEFGEIVGYENHSGLTTLASGQKAFGKVVRGAGNNGVDKTEGARSRNCFGSYLHGPILPKNPCLADELIRLAVSRKFGVEKLGARDEISRKELEKLGEIVARAREIAMKRPR